MDISSILLIVRPLIFWWNRVTSILEGWFANCLFSIWLEDNIGKQPLFLVNIWSVWFTNVPFSVFFCYTSHKKSSFLVTGILLVHFNASSTNSWLHFGENITFSGDFVVCHSTAIGFGLGFPSREYIHSDICLDNNSLPLPFICSPCLVNKDLLHIGSIMLTQLKFFCKFNNLLLCRLISLFVTEWSAKSNLCRTQPRITLVFLTLLINLIMVLRALFELFLYISFAPLQTIKKKFFCESINVTFYCLL